MTNGSRNANVISLKEQLLTDQKHNRAAEQSSSAVVRHYSGPYLACHIAVFVSSTVSRHEMEQAVLSALYIKRLWRSTVVS